MVVTPGEFPGARVPVFEKLPVKVRLPATVEPAPLLKEPPVFTVPEPLSFV